MSSDGYDFEELDSAVFEQFDKLEAAHIAETQATSTRAVTPPGRPSPTAYSVSGSDPSPPPRPTTTSGTNKFRPANTTRPQHHPNVRPASATSGSLASTCGSSSSRPKDGASYETSFDVDDMEMDDEIMASLAAIEAAYNENPKEWKPPPLTRQTTLDGGVIQQPQAGPSGLAAGSSHPFGRRASKTKYWDQTAFAKTGWKSTKGGKGKGKGKQYSDDEEEGEEEIEFAQFPAPFITPGPVPPMKLDIDREAAREWVYPLNHPKRDYQYNIVRNSLFENSLVALPTGLGKTFIAGVIMLNYYRWFPKGKVVFVAPTKPLVAQQIEACHHTCGIPQGDAVELTGGIPRTTRVRHWAEKRVFFMTPQTLVNDMSTGACDVGDIALLVVDEAHKATGDYAYCQVVRYLMATNPHFRVLALTATPGSKPEAVQSVVDSLHISHIEIRNEDSLDLRQYVHQKKLEHTIVPMDGEIQNLKALLAQIMQKEVNRLAEKNIVHIHDVVRLHYYRCNAERQSLQRKPEGKANPWAYSCLTYLGTLARAMGYLMEQSVAMAYTCLMNELNGEPSEADENLPKKKPAAKKPRKPSIKLNDPAVKKLLAEFDRQKASRNGHFPSHPKLDKLLAIALDHFSDGTDAESTRVMVFCTFRACVDEIVEVLNGHSPVLRATRFVGQGADKAGKKGIAQKEQLEVIQQFKDGKYNILVSTSIGEEGLDIGEVDLIVCYDSQKTPIRMLQRIGRTGRKRNGRIEVLSAAGREEFNYQKADTSYKDVQDSIVRGEDLQLFADVERLLPSDLKPECVEKKMEIQEYVKGGIKGKRKAGDDESRPTKKRKSAAVAIPEGAATGFVPVNELLRKGAKKKGKANDKPKESMSMWDEQPAMDDEYDMELEQGLTVPTSKKPSSKKAKSLPPQPKATSPKPETSTASSFMSAKDVVMEEDDSADEAIEKGLNPSPPKKPKATTKPKSSSSKPGPSISTSKSKPRKSQGSSAKPIVIPDSPDVSVKVARDRIPPSRARAGSSRPVPSPPSPPPEMAWLLSDDDAPPAHEPSDPASPVFRRPLPVIRRPPPALAQTSAAAFFDTSMETSPDRSFDVVAPGKRRTDMLPPPVPVLSSPELSFPIRAPTKHVRRPPMRSPLGSDDIPRSSSPDPVSLPSPVAPPPPRRSQPKHSKFKSRIGNAAFEMEAEHSGDEESVGDSDFSDENEYDRSFVTDGAGTQAPDGYDQRAVYRQGLMTQIPNGGPTFAKRPVRHGQFQGGANQHPRRRVVDSSDREDGSEPDQYELGSFVVEDDDGILDVSMSSER